MTNFLNIQQTVVDLIDESAGLVAGSVLLDLGHVREDLEKSLQDNGYAIGVWPPVGGKRTADAAAGAEGLQVTVPVRIEFNPEKLKALRKANIQDPNQPKAEQWVDDVLSQVAAMVLTADPDAGNTRFEFADDAFDLVDFDDGLLSFHMRFTKFCVFGF